MLQLVVTTSQKQRPPDRGTNAQESTSWNLSQESWRRTENRGGENL